MEENEMNFKGKIEDIAVKPTTKGTEYVKLKVNGRTFNFYDMKLYYENKSNFKIGANINIVYFDSKWKGDDGMERTSHTMTTFTFGQADLTNPAEGMKSVSDFVQATQTTLTPEDDIESMMRESVRMAMEITQKYRNSDDSPFFPSEDVRTMANTIFMEACKRRR